MGISNSIKELSDRDWNVELSNVNREGNFAADWMTSIAYSHNQGLVFYQNLPQGIMPILHGDACGIQFPGSIAM